jgi:hypothetical protein
MGHGSFESISSALRFEAARRCTIVSYPWTRVPAGAPPLDGLQLRLLPVADLFMALMWSRPVGLSLRTTWVTPATIALSMAVVPLVGLPGVAALAYGLVTGGILFTVGGLIALALTAGAATTAVYGLRQRQLAR